MAILQTSPHRYHVRGKARFELTPNLPTSKELVDTYQVRLWIHDRIVYERVHSVRNWQMRHYYVEQIARMCCSVEAFIDKSLEFRIPEDSPDEEFWSKVFVKVDTDWLSITASAATPKRLGPLIGLNLSLVLEEHRIGDTEKRSAGQWGEWQERITALILCTPDDACAFGKQLLKEIREAERRRIELGIPESDDEADGDEMVQ